MLRCRRVEILHILFFLSLVQDFDALQKKIGIVCDIVYHYSLLQADITGYYGHPLISTTLVLLQLYKGTAISPTGGAPHSQTLLD